MFTTQLPIHITGYGTFLLSRIEELDDPLGGPLEESKKAKSKTEPGPEPLSSPQVRTKIREIADPAKQESLNAEHDPGAFAAEQTWPTPEELKDVKDIKDVKDVKDIKVLTHTIVEDPKASEKIEQMAVEAGLSDSGDENPPEDKDNQPESASAPLENMADANPGSVHPSDEEDEDDEEDKEEDVKVSAKYLLLK